MERGTWCRWRFSRELGEVAAQSGFRGVTGSRSAKAWYNNYLSQRQCVRNNVIALDNNLATLILGIVLAASGIICVFLANYQYWELRFEVNDRLPEGQKFEPLFWSPLTNLRFRRLHRGGATGKSQT